MTALLSEFLFRHKFLSPYKHSAQVKARHYALVLMGKMRSTACFTSKQDDVVWVTRPKVSLEGLNKGFAKVV